MASIFKDTPFDSLMTNDENKYDVILDVDFNLEQVNESYFSKSLGFLTEATKEYDNANRFWYKAVAESGGSASSIGEGFKKLFEAAGKMIEKFVNFIISSVKRFITSINASVKHDGYLKQHKEDFSKFKDSDEFSFTGFVYSFNPAIPDCNPEASYTDKFMKLKLSNPTEDDEPDLLSDVKNSYNKYITDTKDKGYYDKIRRDVLCTHYHIPSDKYARECFACYRDGEDAQRTIDITPNDLKEVVNHYYNFSDLMKAIENQKNDIVSKYNDIKKDINTLIKIASSDPQEYLPILTDIPAGSSSMIPKDSEIYQYLNLFAKAKVNEVQKIMDIHLTAFTAKMDAMKECYLQDREILYKALDIIQRNH